MYKLTMTLTLVINYALTRTEKSRNIPVIYLEQLPPENIHSFIYDSRTVEHWWPIHVLSLPSDTFQIPTEYYDFVIWNATWKHSHGIYACYLGSKYWTSMKLHITCANTKINFSFSKSKLTFYNFHFIMILHNYFNNIYPSITSHSVLFNIVTGRLNLHEAVLFDLQPYVPFEFLHTNHFKRPFIN